jgi:hypothetical protein
VFQGESIRIGRILEGLDDEMVAAVAQTLRDVTPFAGIDAAPEERWRQFMASTVADAVRGAIEPFSEQIQDARADMDALFATVFDVARRVGDSAHHVLTTEPSPGEIKNWSAVVVFWIFSAAAGYWVGTDFHLGTIFIALGVLVAMFDRCFK